MSDSGIFHKAVQHILSEIVDGPPGSEAYLLNPGDPGILKQLEEIDARTASNRAMEGLTTVASHTDHVLYGITLLNRWSGGEENPWKDANWEESWKKTEVTEEEWKTLLSNLRSSIKKWQTDFAARKEWNDIEARGAAGFVAHLGYHLGAMRQILAAQSKNNTPK